MIIFVGLGNIGSEYAQTRHNIGFMVINELSKRFGIKVNREKYQSEFGTGKMFGEEVLLAKPQTYMNNSGLAVRDLMNKFNCMHNELVIIYDDVDLPVGELRIREKGSAGTHNGMRSIVYHLQYDDFARIRVGIGRPEDGDFIAHVLGAPKGEECEKLNEAIQQAADAAEMIVKLGITQAQGRFNKKPKRRKTEENNEGGTV